ncbi:Glycolipid anchored surface protein 4 precursor [Kalmusia sp. IMI 367209]|nr:Glycolipid anchored surface protein 4 precursor [Kalmusia sp. IMI 367209]
MFRTIDAVKDYENLLGIIVTTFPDPISIETVDPAQYSNATRLARAIVRDAKEYISKNSIYPILVGAAFIHEVRNIWSDAFTWMSCNIANESISSAIDFVALMPMSYIYRNATDLKDRLSTIGRTVSQASQYPPTFLHGISSFKLNSKGEPIFDNETVAEDLGAFFNPLSNTTVWPGKRFFYN